MAGQLTEGQRAVVENREPRYSSLSALEASALAAIAEGWLGNFAEQAPAILALIERVRCLERVVMKIATIAGGAWEGDLGKISSALSELEGRQE